LLLPVIAMGAGLASGANQTPANPDPAVFQKEIRPLFQQFCYRCHGEKNGSGSVSLAAFTTVPAIQKDQTTWREVLDQLRERNMPPPGQPPPTAEQRNHLIDWLTTTLDSVDPSLLPRNPGRVLIHRLSRAEYNNTVRDLFGVNSRPADQFPADGGGGGGFDNDADTLFVPPILMERYLAAASQILDEAKPERIFFVRPGKTLARRAAGRKIIAHFAMLGYRRPVEPAEVDRLMRLFDSAAQRGDSFEAAVKLALKAVLISPNFLFRVEKDRPGDPPYPISDYELASRLSYFLWSSMPDEELFRLAGQQRLRNPRLLEQQVQRMIRSPKSRALADGFAGQWLRVRDLYTTAQPDPRRFPAFTPSLRDAMYQETIDFCDDIVRHDVSLLQLIDANYTYLNEELAQYYGVPGVTGPRMRRVELKDRRRGGVLGMGSVLTLTSYPRRTSPVLRGKWVLEQIMGAPIPPPPPNAGGLPADDAPKQGLTFRQRLEKHRSKPECASCHSRMDPIGFGLENFDPIGRWRDSIGSALVDASGVLATGGKFTGPVELKRHLMQQKDEFIRNVTEKMLAYALGRGLEPYDIPTERAITQAVAHDGYHSSALITAIVKSYPFQFRRNL
jgi:hypothetical protein